MRRVDELAAIGADVREAQRRRESGERIRGEEDIETFISTMNLAKLHGDVGKLAEAEALLTRAVDVGRRTLGEEHPRWIGAMNNLATVYGSQGKFAEAEPILQDAERRTAAHPFRGTASRTR